MNILFQTVVSTILDLSRTCKKCKRDQIVASNKRKKTVNCKFCGADIPPAK